MPHSISETSWSMLLKICGHAHWHVLQPQSQPQPQPQPHKFQRDWRNTFEIMHFLVFFVVVPLLGFSFNSEGWFYFFCRVYQCGKYMISMRLHITL